MTRTRRPSTSRFANRSNADGGALDVVPVFVNTQAYRLIVITCDDIADNLVVSTVDLDWGIF